MVDSDLSFFKIKCKNRNGIFYVEISNFVFNINIVEERELDSKNRKEIF